MADWDIRDGIFRVPKDLARVPRHPETAEKLFQGVNAAIKRVLRLQGITITVEGAEHIPATGGALVAMNHTGYYDFAFMQVPPHIRGKRLVRFMAKREVFDIPVVGRVMRMMDHVSVDRSAGAASVGEAVRELERGRIVGIFPEATISRSFELKSFKNGAVRIARQAGVPLVPSLAPRTMSWMVAAPWSPIRPRSWSSSAPRTASSPKKKPAMAVAMTISGATEKMV